MDQNTAKAAQQMFNAAQTLVNAKVQAAQANPVDEIREIRIDLSVGRTRENSLKVAFPFKAVLVEDATDINTIINLIPENADDGRSSLKLSLLDQYSTDFKFSKCFLFWEPQVGKSMLLKFFTTSKIESGRQFIESVRDPANILSMGGITVENNGENFIFSNILGAGGGRFNLDAGYPTTPPFISAGATLDVGAALQVPAGKTLQFLAFRTEILKTAATPTAEMLLLPLQLKFGPKGGAAAVTTDTAFIKGSAYSNNCEGICRGNSGVPVNPTIQIIDELQCFYMNQATALPVGWVAKVEFLCRIVDK